jgi:hypothetical protein
VVLLLSRRTPDRLALCLVGWGITSIAVADSAFLYLISTDAYSAESHFVSLGWLGGFLAVGPGPLAVDPHGALRDERSTAAAPASVLPYVPLTIAAACRGSSAAGGQSLDLVELVLCGTALATVLARQYATVRDNSRLLSELAEREAELRTPGLPRRADRAREPRAVPGPGRHALDLHRRDLRPLTVLFCDLDDFKVINDTTGHAAVTPCWCGSPSGCAARCAAATRLGPARR